MNNSTKTVPQNNNRYSGDYDNSLKLPSNVTPPIGSHSPNYSKTVDLGSVRSHASSNHNSPEEDDLKQRLNYLEVI